MIHCLESPATQEQIDEMLETWEIVIKVAVDVRRGVLAGGGKMHADCEAELLARGSKQDDIWGATWVPLLREVQYDPLIDIRPSQNPAMEILDEQTRARVGRIVVKLLGAT
jgi:hypothetical protein